MPSHVRGPSYEPNSAGQEALSDSWNRRPAFRVPLDFEHTSPQALGDSLSEEGSDVAVQRAFDFAKDWLNVITDPAVWDLVQNQMLDSQPPKIHMPPPTDPVRFAVLHEECVALLTIDCRSWRSGFTARQGPLLVPRFRS